METPAGMEFPTEMELLTELKLLSETEPPMGMDPLSETEIRHSRMTFKDMVLVNNRREHLLTIIHPGSASHKPTSHDQGEKRLVAMEQLARMTVMMKWYQRVYENTHPDRDVGEEMESMGADLIDASMSVAGLAARSSRQPIFVCSFLDEDRRKAEVRAIVKRMQERGERDIVGTWITNVPAEEDFSRMLREGLERVLGMGIDGLVGLSRSRSEDDIGYRRRGTVVGSRRAWTRRLMMRRLDDLDRRWPLVSVYAIPERRVAHPAVGLSRKGSHEDFHQWQAD